MVTKRRATDNGRLQESFMRSSSMYRKTMLPSDEELGKKDDDHRYKHARISRWTMWNHTFRRRRRRILLAVIGLSLVYYCFHSSSGDYEDPFEPLYGRRPITFTYQKPSANDHDEPTGPPPGIQNTRHGDAIAHTFDGQVRFYHIASSLRSSALETDGREKKNRNILFAMSSLKSVSTLLPMVCEMSQRKRNHVHAAFMGREHIPIEDLLEINGIDKAKCPAIWHDARPDYAESISDARAETAVAVAMKHINAFLHPQAAIMDDSKSEDQFFVRGMRTKARVLKMPLIEVPKDRSVDFGWVTRLDASSLRHWHDPTVDILIQVPPHSSSVLGLLKSIKDADYGGLKPPRITIELPAELDVSVKEYVERFRWPPHKDNPTVRSGLDIRRRISNQRLNQEESAIRFLELFYPANTTNQHVLLLSPQAQLSPQYFHFVTYALLEYKYSAWVVANNQSLMGVSLELPPVLLDGKTKLESPSTGDMHSSRYKKLYPGTESVPFMWQAPNSHATLLLGDKWAELHSFLRNRVVKHRQSVKPTSRGKLVSETLPAWTEYMLEFMRARGYSLFYPAAAATSNALLTVHNELYHVPEEFSTVRPKDGQESPALPLETDAPFLRAHVPPKPPRHPETPVLPGSVPLHQALPFNGELPRIPHLPQLLYDGQQITPAQVPTVANEYADAFRKEVGGCTIPKGKHRKVIAGEASDLFCFGDEHHGDWVEDETREVKLFDAPIDDELDKLIKHAPAAVATSATATTPPAAVGREV